MDGRGHGGSRNLEGGRPALTARDVGCRSAAPAGGRRPGPRPERDANLVRTVAEGPVLVVCGEGVRDARPRRGGVVGRPGGQLARRRAGTARPCPQPSAVARAPAGHGGFRTSCWKAGPTLAGAWWAAGLIDHVVAYVRPACSCGEVGPFASAGPGSETVAEAPAARGDRGDDVRRRRMCLRLCEGGL